MKINKLLNSKVKTIITVFFLIFTCLCMNNFYKMTLGFVANNFEDGMFLINISIAYILPFICFITYFYNYYIKKISKVSNIIYSSLVITISIITLIYTFKYIDVYVSNNSLGAYNALPSLLGGFPYDAIITSIVLIIVQVYNVFVLVNPSHKLSSIKHNFYSLGYFKINIFEYIIMCVIALLSFFFVGNSASGLLMLENVIYDPKYIFVLLWLVLIPMGNLFCYTFKFETRIHNKSNKLLYLGLLLLANIIIFGLEILFEAIHPNYIVDVAKALFPITFSASIPVEMMMIYAIQAIAVLIIIIKVIYYSLSKKEN